MCLKSENGHRSGHNATKKRRGGKRESWGKDHRGSPRRGQVPRGSVPGIEDDRQNRQVGKRWLGIGVGKYTFKKGREKKT